MKAGLYHTVIERQCNPTEAAESKTKSSVITSPADDAFLAQARMDWLQSPVTAQVLKQISTQIEELELRARQLAVSYHVHTNHNEIVALLIRADTLRKFKETYGR